MPDEIPDDTAGAGDGKTPPAEAPEGEYQAPRVRVLGTVEEITHGKNLAGSDTEDFSTGSG